MPFESYEVIDSHHFKNDKSVDVMYSNQEKKVIYVYNEECLYVKVFETFSDFIKWFSWDGEKGYDFDFKEYSYQEFYQN